MSVVIRLALSGMVLISACTSILTPEASVVITTVRSPSVPEMDEAESSSTLREPVDLDGDGLSDYVVLAGAPPSLSSIRPPLLEYRRSIHVWLSGNDQTYTLAPPAGGAFGTRIIPGDFDGDGRAEFYVDGVDIDYMVGFESGTFRFEEFGQPIPPEPSVGDINGDGFDDLVARCGNFVACESDILVFLGAATGLSAEPAQRLHPPEAFSSGFMLEIQLLDITGDGILDLAAGSTKYTHHLSNNGVRFSVGRNAVHIYRGGRDALTTEPVYTFASPFAEPSVDLSSVVDEDFVDDSFRLGPVLRLEGGDRLLVFGYPNQPDGRKLFELWLDGSSLALRTIADIGQYWGAVMGDIDGDGIEDALCINSVGSGGRVHHFEYLLRLGTSAGLSQTTYSLDMENLEGTLAGEPLFKLTTDGPSFVFPIDYPALDSAAAMQAWFWNGTAQWSAPTAVGEPRPNRQPSPRIRPFLF